ncbi:MAG: hypothetical protein MZV49_14380 [Rhodopseudomonas palustris]|nr:hypothetical protein [Rhodopseudomonas palustris]
MAQLSADADSGQSVRHRGRGSPGALASRPNNCAALAKRSPNCAPPPRRTSFADALSKLPLARAAPSMRPKAAKGAPVQSVVLQGDAASISDNCRCRCRGRASRRR